MKPASFLPTLFRWVFAALSVLSVLVALCVCTLMLVDPHLPPGTHYGPIDVDILGQPGTVVVQPDHGDSNLGITAFRGSVTLKVAQAGGLIEVLKRYGLPLMLVHAVFFALLFDLLRRLFRNVERGDSFTQQSVRFVQIIGGSLIVFSLASAFAERFFLQETLAYIVQHTAISVSGTAVHIPPPSGRMFSAHGFPFHSPVFFCGLLVLALAEVFRQGLALKGENDLTV